MEKQLDVLEGRNSSPLAFWRKHHPQHRAMDFVDEWCGTPVHNGLADGAVPSDGVTHHPLSGVVREPWCFRDRAFDEWFDENKARAEGVVGDMWEETGAASALNRLDPLRDYILPQSALSRLPLWDLVPTHSAEWSGSHGASGTAHLTNGSMRTRLALQGSRGTYGRRPERPQCSTGWTHGGITSCRSPPYPVSRRGTWFPAGSGAWCTLQR